MGRIVFFLILVVLLVGAVIWNRRNRIRRDQREAEVLPRSQSPIPMIHCPVCGCAFPKNEAVLGDGVAYCSEKCRRAARHQAKENE